MVVEIGVDGVEVEGDIFLNLKDFVEILVVYYVKVLLVMLRNVDIFSMNERVWLKVVYYFLDLLDWVVDLGVFCICFYGEVGKVRGSGDDERDWSLLVESFKKIMVKVEEL